MKRFRNVLVAAAVLAAFCALPLTSASASSTNDTGPIGLDAMTSAGWNAVPDIHTQVISGQFTSYDRHDANDDGFTGHSFYATEANGDKTIANIQGPGEITKMFFAGVWPSDTQIKIYLDGSATPNISQTFGYFFAGTNAPYLSPLVVPEVKSAGAYSSYLPLPFAQSIKIDVTLSTSNPSGASSVYGVDYQKYPAGTTVQTFDPSNTTNPTQTAVNSIWNAPGTDPKQPTNNYAPVTGTISIPNNGSTTIFNGTGPAQVNAIKITVPGVAGSTASTQYAEDQLNNLGIRIYWDGETTPSVTAPLGSFFGTGLYGAAQPAKAVPFGFDGTSFYLYFPMPFQTSAKIQLYSNRAADTAGVSYTVLDAPFTGSFTNVGYFHTQYHFARARATDPFDYVALSTVGSGKYVGLQTNGAGSPDSTSPYNDQPVHWMEGDAHIYLDGSQTPQWNGTGTEDYFGGAGYFCCGNGSFSYPASQGGFSYFTNALNGFTAHEYPPPNTSYSNTMTGNMAMYRIQPNDGVNFHSSITVSFEHGGGIRPVTPPSSNVPLNVNFQNQNSEAWTLAFYYYLPQITEQTTDTLNVGTTASETSHSYTVTGSTAPTNTANSWEGTLDAISYGLTGRTFSGYSQFNLTVSSANQGVILRRTFNQSAGPQSANVYVGGVLVGPWSYPGSNSNFAWRDDDFVIPSSFTTGASSITVKVVNSGATNWAESRYQALSIVSGTAATQPYIASGATLQISPLSNHLDLDVSGGATAPGSGVVQTVSLGAADGQLWRAIPLVAANTYAFVNVNSGLVLAGNADSQADIVTWTGAATQQWILLPAATAGYYVIKNVGNSHGATSEVLDNNSSASPGTTVQQTSQTNTAAQQWRFEVQDTPATLFPITTGGPSTPAPIQSGTAYTVNVRVSGLNLDLTGGPPATAGQLVQEYTPNTACSQKWLFTQVALNTYTLATTCPTSPTGQNLVLQDQGIGNQIAVEPLSGSSGSAAQQWRVEFVKDGITDSYYRLVNVGDSNVLNVCNSGATGCQGANPGDPAQVYTWDATTAALWRLQAQDTPTCTTLPNGCGRWYEFSPLSNINVSLDDINASPVAGSGVQVYTTNHTCSQEWRADYVVNGYYKLTSLCGNKVLGVTNGSTASGASTQIWDWNGTDAQLWRISTAVTTGYVTLTNKASGKALDAGASSSGTGVSQQTSNSSTTSQQWKMNLEP